MRHAIVMFMMSALLFVACRNEPINTPVPGESCHYQEIACRDDACCPASTECGGEWPNCPKDYCCATGQEPGGPLFGLHLTPKRRLRRP